MTPQFKHDCDQCRFLGTFNDHDLYFCSKGSGATVIARWSDNGPDYTSGLHSAAFVPELSVARYMATLKGLLT